MNSFTPEEKQMFETQTLLYEQKIITEEATNLYNESTKNVYCARIVLEAAQKTHDELVIAMTSYKTDEIKETTTLTKLQCEIDVMKAARQKERVDTNDAIDLAGCATATPSSPEEMVSPGKITGFDRPKSRTELEWQQWGGVRWMLNNDEEEDPCINEMGVHCCCVCCTKGCCRCDRYQ